MTQIKSAGSKTICLPLASEAEYAKVIQTPVIFRQFLLQPIKLHPELFPPGIDEGFWLHGKLHSTKQQLQIRRIFVFKTMETYKIRPDVRTSNIEGVQIHIKTEKGKTLRLSQNSGSYLIHDPNDLTCVRSITPFERC